jgi:hypothetical protein
MLPILLVADTENFQVISRHLFPVQTVESFYDVSIASADKVMFQSGRCQL